MMTTNFEFNVKNVGFINMLNVSGTVNIIFRIFFTNFIDFSGNFDCSGKVAETGPGSNEVAGDNTLDFDLLDF